MSKKILHGNGAKINLNEKIDPVYQSLLVTSKQQSNEHSINPVTTVTDDNVILSKQFVDENHK